MAKTIGRLGYIGLGLEATAGTATTADVYLPFVENTLRGHHEPIEITSSKTARFMDTGSVVGKKWSEGDVTINLDVVNSGYLFKMALGNELLETGTPNSHTFYATASGNTPKTATLFNGRDTDAERYAYTSVNELVMDIPTDGLSTLKASMMGQFPTAAASQTVTTTSGSVVTFADAAVEFGSTLTTADAADATAVNGFNLTIANNTEMIHQTGSSDVVAIRTKGFKASGSYTLYFDSETDKNAHYALNKRSMIVTLTGNSNEELRIRVPQFRLQENDISTGLDDFFVQTGDFVAEDVVDSGARSIDVRVQNSKSDVY